MQSGKWFSRVALVAFLLCIGSMAFAQPDSVTVYQDTNNGFVYLRWKVDKLNPAATSFNIYKSATWPVITPGVPYKTFVVAVPPFGDGVYMNFGGDYGWGYQWKDSVQSGPYYYYAVTSVQTAGCVYGTVTDAGSSPVLGARVHAINTVAPFDEKVAYSNGVGDYIMCGLTPGNTYNFDILAFCGLPATPAGSVVPSGLGPVQHDITYVAGVTIVQKSGHIVANETWSPPTVYQLVGQVIVDPGVLLTIDPGTQIIGAYPTVSVLIFAAGGTDCSPGGGIYAVGTVNSPIVFTSNRQCGERATGDWGGIVINSRAHNNRGPVPNGEGDSGPFGQFSTACDDNTHDTNITMRYCRLEFPGYRFTPTNELNGICLQAVGAGADISYCQVTLGQDDAIEFFGGTASVHHMILNDSGDDHIDWTDGWQGAVHMAVVHQRGPDSDSGIEADNLEQNHQALPRAFGYISNVTFIGKKGAVSTSGGDRCVHMRRGTRFSMRNCAVTLAKLYGFDMDDAATCTDSIGSQSEFKYSCFWNNGTVDKVINDPPVYTGGVDGNGDGHFRVQATEYNEGACDTLTPNFAWQTIHIAAPTGWHQDAANWGANFNGCGYTGTNALNFTANPQLVNPAGFPVFDARPALGSPLLNPANAAPSLPTPPYPPTWWPLPLPNYIGAFSGPADTWADGWTNYPAN